MNSKDNYVLNRLRSKPHRAGIPSWESQRSPELQLTLNGVPGGVLTDVQLSRLLSRVLLVLGDFFPSIDWDGEVEE